MELIKTPQAEHFDLPGRTLSAHPDNRSLTFPDGEVYVQLKGVETIDEAFVIHSGAPKPNQGLMYLYGLLDILRIHNIPTHVLFTYFPYSRQDQDFYNGTLNYAKSIVDRLSNCYNVKSIRAVDPHFHHKDWTQDLPVSSVRSFELVKQAVEMEDYEVVVPDVGAKERFGIKGFEKERITSEDVAVSGELDLEGKNVLVFDDIIATGRTMVQTYTKVKRLGAKRVEAAAIHGVMCQGLKNVKEKYDKLYLTNSVQSPYSNVDIEEAIREEIEI